MKSDVINVTNTGSGISAAMEQAAAAASYRGLSEKETLRLRLLAEEMLGMLREITGETEGQFWVESEGERFMLHLAAHPIITAPMRQELMSVSSTGKNAAAVGVMGKLRDIFERAFDSSGIDSTDYYLQGMLLSSTVDSLDAAADTGALSWSLNKLKDQADKDKASSEEAMEVWDELEKSIVANLADEVSISIRGRQVEMTVYKSFAK